MAAKPGTSGTISEYPTIYAEALDAVLTGETFANRYAVQGAEFVNGRQVSVPDISFPEASDPNDYDRFQTEDKFTLSRTVYTLDHDKQCEFYVDACDTIDESAASVNQVTAEWMRTTFMPFVDKDFFKVCADKAKTKATETLTVENIKSEIRKARSQFRKAGLAGGDLYMTSDTLALLEDATERHWSNEGTITDTIGSYDGFNVFEVPDDTLGQDMIIISGGIRTVRYITKRAASYLFPAGTHTHGDGDLGQHRWVFGTIVQKNKAAGIYANKAAD